MHPSEITKTTSAGNKPNNKRLPEAEAILTVVRGVMEAGKAYNAVAVDLDWQVSRHVSHLPDLNYSVKVKF